MSQRKTILRYLPHVLFSLCALALLGIIMKTFMFLKDYGDFATTSFVLQAKAECLDTSKTELQRHEDWESGQFRDMNMKIDKIYDYIIKLEK